MTAIPVTASTLAPWTVTPTRNVARRRATSISAHVARAVTREPTGTGARSVTSYDALRRTRDLIEHEGIFAGISTGANVVGAHRLAERLGPEAVIVSIAVDTGFKYLSVSPYADL